MFQPGNKLGGRKGYGFEKAQLEKMWDLLNKYLERIDKVLSGETDDQTRDILQLIGADMRKIIDKLHVDQRVPDNKVFVFAPIELLEKHEIAYSTKPNSEVPKQIQSS